MSCWRWSRGWATMWWAAMALAAAAVAVGPTRAAEPTAEVEGTILSIRGSILVVRPTLRPRMTRIAVDDSTIVTRYERASLPSLRPGMRVQVAGRYSDQGGFVPGWLEAGDRAVGELAAHSTGLEIHKDQGWAREVGTLKSVEPLVVVDDAGAPAAIKTSALREVWHIATVDRRTLLIGTRIDAAGPQASDGVIQARYVSVEPERAANGTMFGTVISVGAGYVKLRPRYTDQTVTVRRTAACVVQRNITLDADTIHVGDRVTVWGQQRAGATARPADDLLAFALLVGDGRYPSASGDAGGVFKTGRLIRLEPSVRLQADDGSVINVIITAQMAIARLMPATWAGLRPGAEGMFVLRRDAKGAFVVSNVILDAPPFVGYGG